MVHPSLLTPMQWRNKKTSGLYYAHGVITNATNAVDGQLVVLYEAVNSGIQFVREQAEFLEKFTPVKDQTL